MKRVNSFVILIALFLTACGNNQITVKDAWVRSGKLGQNSAIYMVIENPTAQDDNLLSVDSEAAEAVELHMSVMDEQGTMSMQRQANIPVPKSATVELKPGGLHIMLINLQQDLIADEYITLTLTFQNAGEITLDVPIKSP